MIYKMYIYILVTVINQKWQLTKPISRSFQLKGKLPKIVYCAINFRFKQNLHKILIQKINDMIENASILSIMASYKHQSTKVTILEYTSI